MSDSADVPVQLTAVSSESQAAMIIAALKDQGLEAVAEGALTANFRAENFGDVMVMVRQEDLEQARSALTNFLASAHEINWDEVDVGDPVEPGDAD